MYRLYNVEKARPEVVYLGCIVQSTLQLQQTLLFRLSHVSLPRIKPLVALAEVHMTQRQKRSNERGAHCSDCPGIKQR